MQNGSSRGLREGLLLNATQENAGQTALHEAASIGDEKSLQVLLAAGADRNAKDHKHGNTPLHEAAWRGYSRCVKALCALPQPKIGKDAKELKLKCVLQETHGALHSALLGTRNSGGFSALHLAAQNGHNQSCREILLAGGDPDVQNNYGDTPLHTACRYGHAGATRILLSAKCDPNRTNLNGDTPLHISCAMGRRKLTRILLEAGSSIEIKNAQNETPKNIALRKNLPEIIEILDSPVIVKTPKDRDRSSSNSKSADQVDGEKLKPNKKSHYVADPANWSPYGCHYFPDPRSFPSPKLETLPKEPLGKGEQYYLDLAGNIRKGPIGVGNTCYCGPFFRHIEERISRNRKSIRKYVHKATERLDSKVQALALKTDDQIEQLTRSMIADRIQCEGRRLHLEQWLKRGDPTRVTVGHYLKSKKNLDNTNTLTRCKSLELLDDTSLDDKKIQNSKSFDILDEVNVIVHHHEDDDPLNALTDSNVDQRCISLQTSSDRKNSNRSGSSGGRLDCDNYSVSERLEELLAKTNEILELEKISRRKKKQISHNTYTPVAEAVKKKESKMSHHSIENFMQHLKKESLSNDKHNCTEDVQGTEFIEKEMRKITSSLLHDEESEIAGRNLEDLPSLSPEIIKELPSQKEIERRSDQEHEKSSILSGSSQKNSSPSGSGGGCYVPEFDHRLRSYSTKYLGSRNIEKIDSNFINHQSSLIDGIHYTPNYQYILNAPQNNCRLPAEKEIFDEENHNSLYNNNSFYKDENNSFVACHPDVNKNGLYQKTDVDDAASSSNNTLKSEKHKKLLFSEKVNPDQEDTIELSEMANVDEINDLKNRILNGSNWKSQVLKKTQQQMNKKSASDNKNEAKEVNKTIQKFEIKNSEIKTLKNPQQGILKRSKVQELVAKLQDTSSYETDNTTNSPNFYKTNQKVDIQDEHSESSEDDQTNEEDKNSPEKRIYMNKVISKHYQQKQVHCVNDEDDYYYSDINIAQPQVSASMITKLFNHEQSNNFVNSQHLINLQKQFPQKTTIDSRNLIPKDAYFHELPNKNRMRTIADKLPEKQMINFSNHFQQQNQVLPIMNLPHYQQSSSVGQPSLSSTNSLNAARTRNPLPYLQRYDSSTGVLLNDNYTLNSPENNCNVMSSTKNINLNPHKHILQPEKLLTNRKFGMISSGGNYANRESIDFNFFHNNHHQQSQIMHSPSLLHHQLLSVTQNTSITPEQAQVERDSNNDSGYSTKVGGSSHGPSPSLSGSTICTGGTEFGIGSTNGMMENNKNSSEISSVMTKTIQSGQHTDNKGDVTYFIGNIGASSLV